MTPSELISLCAVAVSLYAIFSKRSLTSAQADKLRAEITNEVLITAREELARRDVLIDLLRSEVLKLGLDLSNEKSARCILQAEVEKIPALAERIARLYVILAAWRIGIGRLLAQLCKAGLQPVWKPDEEDVIE